MILIRTQLTVDQWRKKERADQLAHKVAFDSALSIMESYSTTITDTLGRTLWYELDPGDHKNEPWIAEALLYLDLCGLLRRHPRFPNRVNVRWG